ncbi:chorion peroxidase-like [Penaeus vannamei]|uniref:chorion peroxidase-like n=1 Tax=Penaeus vannamei TaxID=6689 RepID=UPI00387F8642
MRPDCLFFVASAVVAMVIADAVADTERYQDVDPPHKTPERRGIEDKEGGGGIGDNGGGGGIGDKEGRRGIGDREGGGGIGDREGGGRGGGGNEGEKGNRDNLRQYPTWQLEVTEEDERASLQYGLSRGMEKDRLEEHLYARKLQVEKDSAAYWHQKRFREPSPRVVEYSRKGYEMDMATSFLKERLNITDKNAILELEHSGELVKEQCDAVRAGPPNCDRFSRYRSADGTCNNLKNPTWGATFTPHRRFAGQDYGDGVSSLRKATAGDALPNARLVSLAVSSRPGPPSTSFSYLHLSFGQFLDHDLVLTPLVPAPYGGAIACCPEALGGDASLVHPECAPIDLLADDPFYGAFGQTCMEFLRSAPATRCHFGPREQMNEITPYLDGSGIYGSDLQTMDSLRAFRGGKLLLQVTGEGVELLQPKKDLDDGWNHP